MYRPKIYNGQTESQIKESIKELGFAPTVIQNSSNFIYSKHKHPETKLIVILKGDMFVAVGKKHYQCEPGDEIIIPGNTEHSAKVGKNGCKFFWSEKL